MVYETSNVLLPVSLRKTKFYQATVDRLLRIVIELVGDVHGVYADQTTSVEELMTRKTAGNVVEICCDCRGGLVADLVFGGCLGFDRRHENLSDRAELKT